MSDGNSELMDTVYAALQLVQPNAVFVTLPALNSEQLELFSGNLKAVILCNVSLPVFVVEQLTGELVTWGECSSLAQALQATFDALQLFAYRQTPITLA